MVFILALSFGIGRGLPFLIVSAFAGAVSKFAQLTWLRRSIQIVSGLALLFVCYYYVKVSCPEMGLHISKLKTGRDTRVITVL